MDTVADLDLVAVTLLAGEDVPDFDVLGLLEGDLDGVIEFEGVRVGVPDSVGASDGEDDGVMEGVMVGVTYAVIDCVTVAAGDGTSYSHK